MVLREVLPGSQRGFLLRSHGGFYLVPREGVTWFPERVLPGSRSGFYLVLREVLPGSQRGFNWFPERFYLVPREVSDQPAVCLVYPDFPGYPTWKSHRLEDINLPAKI